MTVLEDLYGNPIQQETPTTRLIKSRVDNRAESDGHFKLAAKIYPNMHKKGVVEYLRKVAETVESSKAERFRFEFTIEEITEKENQKNEH